MSIQSQVQNTKNPQEALLVIARALDTIVTKLDTTPVKDDGWGEWENPVDETPAVDHLHILDLRKRLETEKDPEEIQAIAAELKLLTDDGTNQPEATLPKGTRVTIEPDGEGGMAVTIPPPNDDQLEKRELFADEVLKPHYDWDDAFIDSFKRGGPLLLYYNDREMVRTLPPLWIRQFIEDVEVNSPEEANEMARDLLKDVEPDSMQDLTIENLRRDLENV